MKILSGRFKGRSLHTPSSRWTRPTMSLVRKALFDILQDKVKGAVFLDVCAGSGSMGLEALSRGARQAVFIEVGRSAMHALRKNISLLGVEEETVVLQADVFKALSHLEKEGVVCDIIYIDPPYGEKGLYDQLLVRQLLVRLDRSSLLRHEGTLWIESWRDRHKEDGKDSLPSHVCRQEDCLYTLQKQSSRFYGHSQLESYLKHATE